MPDRDNNSTSPLIAAIPIALGLAAVGLEVTDEGTVVRATGPEPQALVETLSPEEQALIEEHVYMGLPSTQNVAVRNGYVRGFLPEARIPLWVGYRVIPEYRDTPDREGRFSSFRRDRDVANPVVDSDYTGLFATRGFARGHLAPFGVMGGDRDGDGELAPNDDFDNDTVFQANFMTNIAPQHHEAFNGSGGLWFELERKIQDEWVTELGREVFVFAGCVVGPGEHEMVGPDNDILVPPMFFKIVILAPEQDGPLEENEVIDDMPRVLAFLFPHQRIPHGDLEDYLVTVDVIEALTGLDFFNELADSVQAVLEDTDTIANWSLFEGTGTES